MTGIAPGDPSRFRPADSDQAANTPGAALRWIPLVLVLGLMGMAARRAFRPIGDPDTWWHLRLGADIWHHWDIVDPAPWTRFVSEPWVATQWLPEVVASRFEAAFGLPGVVWLWCAGLVVLTTVLYLVCRGEADILAATVATFVAFLGMSTTLTPRPQLVSFILLLVVAGAWLRTARDLRPRWWLIPVSWLWACSHGMWFSGIAVGAAVIMGLALDRRVRGAAALRLVAIPVASLLVAALTPAGPRLLLSPFTVGAITQFISEWAPPSIHDLSPAATAVMIAAVAIAWARGREVAWTQIALLLLATCWVLLSARTVTLAAAIAAPLLAGALQSLLPGTTQEVGRRERAALLAGVLACLATVALLLPGSTGTPANVPNALNASLDRLPPHTVVFNNSTLGGWLLWRHPRLEPVIDGRAEAFPKSHFKSYIRTSQVRPGWEKFLQTTSSKFALVETDSPLAAALEERLHWRSLGTDVGYVLLAAPP
jgi:hypothetical protein